jgi:hypothetical protein
LNLKTSERRRKNMLWKTMFIGLMIFSCATYAQESITISDKNEIEMAKKISASIDKLSGKVMGCMETRGGEHEGCTCETREVCPFKEEYDEFVNTVCTAYKSYPAWKANNLYYETNTLATKNMYSHYGKYCK